jgi:hypothetical protein
VATCKGCGKEIVWGVTPDGKRIPLDPKPPIYAVAQDVGGALHLRRMPTGDVMVSHFATCPQANEFSASKRRKGAASV